MRALWSDRPNCSHNVSQKVKRIRRVSEISVQFYTETAELEAANLHVGGCQFIFWRVPIYSLGAEIVFGVLYRKGGSFLRPLTTMVILAARVGRILTLAAKYFQNYCSVGKSQIGQRSALPNISTSFPPKMLKMGTSKSEIGMGWEIPGNSGFL